MKKVKKFFKALSMLLAKPYLLNLVIEHSDFYKKQVLKKYNKAEGLPQVDTIDFFGGFDETVEPYAFLEGGSTPADLGLLKALARKYKVIDFLEIGTWRGESVANVAAVAKNCYTLNLSPEDLQKMNKSKAYIDSQGFFSKKIPSVTHLQGHSHCFDFGQLKTKYDMVFIDGDHHYESVKKDTQTAFNLLKDDNSIIVWHDYGVTPENVRWEVLLGILDGAPAGKRSQIYHFSHTLCAVYIPHTVTKTAPLQAYQIPQKHFSVRIKAIQENNN